MTSRQKYLYDFIKSYLKKHGCAPDYVDMKQHMHLKSKSTIHYMLKQLEAEGKIKINIGKCRGIEIASTQKKQIEIYKKQLHYAEKALRAIMVTTSDSGTAMYAYDVLFTLKKERECPTEEK